MDIIHTGGLPVVNPLLPHILQNICKDSEWVYAVFWRIQPRSYPPPKWDTENGYPRRAKENKSNWILAWDDAFCDFSACSHSRPGHSSSEEDARKTLQPDLFFKMSHEIYNLAEGLMGKVAAENSHKWVHKNPPEQEISLLCSWQTSSLVSYPRTWEAQFKAGIETIALIAVQEGLLQLGSLRKTMEDLNFVLLLQTKFNTLPRTIPASLVPYPCRMQAMSRSRSLPSRCTLSEKATLDLMKRKRVWDGDGLTNWGSYESALGLNCREPFEGYDAPHRLFSNNYLEFADIPPSFKYHEPDRLMHSAIPAVAIEQASSALINSSSIRDDFRKLPVCPPPSKTLNISQVFVQSGITCRSSLCPSMSNLQALLSKVPPVRLPNQASKLLCQESPRCSSTPNFPRNTLSIDGCEIASGQLQASHQHHFKPEQNANHHKQAIQLPHMSKDDISNEKMKAFPNTIEVEAGFDLQEDRETIDDLSYVFFLCETTS